MKQKGAQAVEFALVLPFFILILFAVLDFGILVYNKAIITNASREGARSGALLSGTWDSTAVQQVACNYARNTLISVNSGTSTSTCTGTKDPVVNVYWGSTATCPSPATLGPSPTFGVPVALKISYPFSGFSLGSWWSLGTGTSSVGSQMTLTACTQMAHE